MADKTEIVLIGPLGAGKSTVGSLLARRLNLHSVSLDAHPYYAWEMGFDREKFARLLKGPKPYEADLYFQTFFPGALERLLAEHHNCVFDLGAGHTVYEDPAMFERVQSALEPFPNVVLILPSPDPDESIRVLRAREQERGLGRHFLGEHFDYFGLWVRSRCNYDLAKITVYTEGKTPEQTTEEVLRSVSKSAAPAED